MTIDHKISITDLNNSTENSENKENKQNILTQIAKLVRQNRKHDVCNIFGFIWKVSG